jgi:hypothetical protein
MLNQGVPQASQATDSNFLNGHGMIADKIDSF